MDDLGGAQKLGDQVTPGFTPPSAQIDQASQCDSPSHGHPPHHHHHQQQQHHHQHHHHHHQHQHHQHHHQHQHLYDM